MAVHLCLMHKPCCCGRWSWWWARSSSGPTQLLCHWGWQRPGCAEPACSRTPRWCLQQAERRKIHAEKQMTLTFAYFGKTLWRTSESGLLWLSFLSHRYENHSVWNKGKQSSGDCGYNALIDHIKPLSKGCEEECPCHWTILFSPCTHLCFCTWSHWTAEVVQVPDINLRIICSGCKEITLK